MPKVAQPKACGDFRPITVTPILSRLLEKLVVRQFIYPVLIENDDLSDQFSFRPTGSTTAALINLLHKASALLQDHDYVHLISIDFSKAFDTVRHSKVGAEVGRPTTSSLHTQLVCRMAY